MTSNSNSGLGVSCTRQCSYATLAFEVQKVLKGDGGQDTQSSRSGNRLRPAVDTEFAVDVAGVGLDRVQREEKPGSDLSIG